MVEAEEVKLQLKATYRREAEVSDRRAKMARAIEVTERQVAMIDQKLAALHDMKARLDEKLAQYNTWLQHLEDQSTAQT
jgi:septal ring factor EnvC (AmiA/AmiB activator)